MSRTSTTTATLARAVLVGAVAGVVASLVMATYAMGAAWSKDVGFFTPLHHIASLWTSPDAMMASMEAAMAGSAFQVEPGPALLGAAIHMTTGALYGAGFGLLVSRARLGTAALAGFGLGYGLLVFVLSAFVGLPVAAGLFDSGAPIRDMAEMAGWGTFVVEHLLYGLVLGLLTGVARSRSTAVDADPAHTH